MTARPPDTTLALIGEALRLGSLHLRQTLTLARLETNGNIGAILGLVALLGAAVLALIVAFFLLLAAAVKALAAIIGSEALAAVIVAAPFALASLVLLVLGLRRMALENLEPKRTERQMAKDAAALRGLGHAGSGATLPPRSS
ncbi:MAG: phage holin family protein [Methylobacterium sp.]|uniref:phage holin family protein n=1 Tax=Methylobacterium sp. TaxID=409 RepID=UPI0025CE1537|nr:phage holin family protein [Methylobacterium sp.]MBX9931823.1 phage holin family protein [Methylobacterium sp.]